MLALSSPLFFTAYGWPSENLQQDCNVICPEFEANAYDSLLDFHTYNQIQHDFAREGSISVSSEGVANENIGEPMKVAKKLNHNASERDRRKRVNELYAFLRSLLPISSDQKKKVSIPGTLSCALKYIPELEKQVGILKRKKENLSSYSTPTANTRQEHLGINKQSAQVSVNILGDKEVVIQLISSYEHRRKNKKIHLLSMVLEYLEQEEDGLVLKNATSFKRLGEGMLLSTLHLQAQRDHKIEAEKLKEKLSAFDQ